MTGNIILAALLTSGERAVGARTGEDPAPRSVPPNGSIGSGIHGRLSSHERPGRLGHRYVVHMFDGSGRPSSNLSLWIGWSVLCLCALVVGVATGRGVLASGAAVGLVGALATVATRVRRRRLSNRGQVQDRHP
jgi:hypothetical protein